MERERRRKDRTAPEVQDMPNNPVKYRTGQDRTGQYSIGQFRTGHNATEQPRKGERTGDRSVSYVRGSY